MFNRRDRSMASLSDSSLPNPLASPLRALLLGTLLMLLVPLGLNIMTTEETSFYRTHGMVPDARTAVRLAQVALETGHPACTLAPDAAAELQGEVWTVEARKTDGATSCRVQLDRKDGQVLRVEAPRAAG